MALTTTTSVNDLSVSVLIEAIQGAIAGRKLMLGTGAWSFRPGLPMTQIGGQPMRAGTTIQIPYFDSLGEMDDPSESGALTPAELTSTNETATVARTGKAFESTMLALLTSQAADPYAEGSRQIAEALMRRLDKAAIDSALARAVSDSMINDQDGGGTAYPVLLLKRNAGITWYTVPDVEEDRDILAHTRVTAVNAYHATHAWKRPQGGAGTKPGVALLRTLLTGGNTFSEDQVIDTQALFGDEISSVDPIVMLAMHSAVATFAKKLKTSTGERIYKDGPMEMGPDGLVKTGPDRFCGIPVYVSDRLVAS
jgi:hypothetical protein